MTTTDEQPYTYENHDTRALDEQLAELSPEQRKVLDTIVLAWHNRNSGFDALGQAVTRGKQHGITWGMIAMSIGIDKPNIWRWYQRWKKSDTRRATRAQFGSHRAESGQG